jgi:hypothetical protein
MVLVEVEEVVGDEACGAPAPARGRADVGFVDRMPVVEVDGGGPCLEALRQL